jgi:hypothetical protein
MRIALFSRSRPGGFTVVSDEDYSYLSSFRWTAVKGYARAWTGGDYIWMAVEVLRRMGLTIPYGLEVDHINRNPLDNRRENLRVVTRLENNANRSCISLSYT